MIVATYFYFEKVRRTMRPAIVSSLLKEACCALKCTWDDVLNDEFIEKCSKFFKELENT